MDLLSGITHIHHASFKIFRNGMNIYIDPFEIHDNKNDADFIFCTHTHHDHLSVFDIQRISKKSTIIIVPKDGLEKVKNLEVKKIITVEPEVDYDIEKLKFSTVRAYNISKKFHPKENNWVGYVINFDETKYYFAGDTDFTPEMKKVSADVAFLPVGGTYTMNRQEAAEAANTIKPKIVVPMHFGHIVGTKKDGEKFKSLIDKSIEVQILI